MEELKNIMHDSVHPFIEYALDYAGSGLYNEASQFLNLIIEIEGDIYPMTYYALGYFESQSNNLDKSKEYYLKASKVNPERCFPNRIEEVNILKDALATNPNDSNAYYYLGNLWYGFSQYDNAIDCWETSIKINDKFSTALRNLALAYYNKLNKKEEAKELMEKAFELDTTDSRILMELDQLYKKTGVDQKIRLALIEKHLEVAEERDDLCIERITIYNHLGEHKKAKELIDARHFHPWKGGEGKITKQYSLCRIELAKKAIEEENYQKAIKLLHETDSYPHNLGEGKLSIAEENDIEYFKGVAYRGALYEENAMFYFHKATMGSSEPKQSFFYNDHQADKIYYQGLAWKALYNSDKANSCFNKLIDHGKKYLFFKSKIDYFAVSLPDLAIWDEDLDVRNKVHCYYMMGLGYLGLGESELAKKYLSKVVELDINHIDSHIILKEIQSK